MANTFPDSGRRMAFVPFSVEIAPIFVRLFFVLSFLLTSCGEDTYAPKPRGYFRIGLPEHRYVMFDPADCPFRFKIPEGALAIRDSGVMAEPCWYYIVVPSLNAQIYLTYKPVKNDFARYLQDTHELVYKHTTRASSIDEQILSFRPGVAGVLYELGGEAASATQFFVTDSTRHFLRGALYFNAAPNADSLAPVQEHMRQDILEMLKSLEWK